MKILHLFLGIASLASAQEPLTNDSIIKLVKAGLGEGLLITMVQSQPGRYSLTPDDLVKLKKEGVPDKILAAMVAKGQASFPATPPGVPAGTSTAQSNTFFVAWRDPQENAFQVGVPQGWQVRGGLTRPSQIEPHSVIRVQSPDGKIQVFYDDPDLHPRQVPDRMMQLGGMREGQTIQGAWGGPVLLARYSTGTQFAQQYIAGKLCRQPVITEALDLREATEQMNATIRPFAARQRMASQASIGEATFRCGNSAGYVMASTVYTKPAVGAGAVLWFVYQLGGFQVSDPEQAGLAFYVLNTMLETYQMNPQWEARMAQELKDVTGAVTEMQHAMTQSIAQYGQRQASAASAGGFNHPNSGHLPTDLRKKWASEDGSRQKFSDATMGQKWMHSSNGANVRVDGSSTNWYRDHSGNVVRGPEGGGPPPGSQGQYEKLQPGWQP